MGNRKNIGIVTGGLNEEREISLLSAGYIHDNLDPVRFASFTLYMDGPDWIDHDTGLPVDKNDFSIVRDGRKINFDAVVLMIHGDPAENGKIQGYFELLGIPHTTCDTLCSALTFDKQKCKDFLVEFGIQAPPSIILNKGEEATVEMIAELRFPVFVKPNCGGSSVGISKVLSPGQLPRATELAFQYDEKVIVETFLDGREFSCGAIDWRGELIVFPITEIIPENEFFDYGAKYHGEAREITPAEVGDEMAEKCKELSARLYRILDCRGVVRFDYILEDDIFYYLEANTIPGLSPQSIVPQQARAYGWTDRKLVDTIMEVALPGE